MLKTLGCHVTGGSPSLFFILVFLFSPESLLYAWVSFQHKWVFLNIVLYEMNITLPSAELVSRACCLEGSSLSSLDPSSILLPFSFSMPPPPCRIPGSSEWMPISGRSCG